MSKARACLVCQKREVEIRKLQSELNSAMSETKDAKDRGVRIYARVMKKANLWQARAQISEDEIAKIKGILNGSMPQGIA